VEKLTEFFEVQSEIIELPSGRSCSPAEFNERVHERAKSFRQLGIQPGDRVLIETEQSIEFLITMFSIWQLNSVAFLMPSKLTKFEADEHFEMSNPRWRLKRATYAIPERLQTYIESELPADCCLGLFTSGTTGKPKIVLHGFKNINARLQNGSRAIPQIDRATSLLSLPLHFGHGLIGVALQALFDGEKLLLPSSEPTEAAVNTGRWVKQYGVNFLSGTPLTWNLICRFSNPPIGPGVPASLERMNIASAFAPKALLESMAKWGEAPIYNTYGLTETASWISGAKVELNDENVKNGSFTIGSGDDWGTEFTCNAPNSDGVGELLVQTASLGIGYGNFDIRARAFKIELFDRALPFRTSDLCIQQNGRVWLCGRESRQINRGGVKVSPEEVESVILESELVAEVAVVDIDMQLTPGIPTIAALVVLRPNLNSDKAIQRVKEYLENRLSRFKHPKTWIVTKKLPKLKSGKVDLGASRRMCLAEVNFEKDE
jgi:acyl-coenzyme A synthetase/AMP-(fatty) acid ligase